MYLSLIKDLEGSPINIQPPKSLVLKKCFIIISNKQIPTLYGNTRRLQESKGSIAHVRLVSCNIFLPLRAFLMELKWKGKRQSVSERIHYVIRDLGMDQLLLSVGMPVIDSAHADVSRHSSHTSLSLDTISM